MICSNCEFEIEEGTEICPYCHVFVNPPGERAAKQERLARQAQAVLATWTIMSKREFVKTPEMTRARNGIRISLGILYLSFFFGFCGWAFRSLDTPFIDLCSLLGMPRLGTAIFMRMLGFSFFSIYLYLIGMFVVLLVIHRTYNHIIAMFFLLPCLLFCTISLFGGLVEGAAVCVLIGELCTVQSAWEKYKKSQTEEKLLQYTLLKEAEDDMSEL